MSATHPTPAEMAEMRRRNHLEWIDVQNEKAVHRLGVVSIVTAPDREQAIARATMLLNLRLPVLRITEGSDPVVVDIQSPSTRPAADPLDVVKALAKWEKAA